MRAMNTITNKTDKLVYNFFKQISKLYKKNTHKKNSNPEELIMVVTDSLSFVLSCCSIPF